MQRFHREAAASALGVLGYFATGGSMSAALRQLASLGTLGIL
jgi:hypothetical protein